MKTETFDDKKNTAESSVHVDLSIKTDFIYSDEKFDVNYTHKEIVANCVEITSTNINVCDYEIYNNGEIKKEHDYSIKTSRVEWSTVIQSFCMSMFINI